MPQLTMKDVFVECGASLQCHGKLIKTLQKLHQSTEPDLFWSKFQHLLKYSLVVYAREPAVERTIEFVAKFVTSLCVGEKKECEEDDEQEAQGNFLLNKLFAFLLQSHSASNQSVRFRSCQLINKLLSNLGEDAQIDDDLYNEIFEGMLQRVRDKLPVVRVQAVQALARLQDPTDKECPVINAYLFLIGCDQSPDVRKAVLMNIAPSTQTLSAILARTRDVKEAVRRSAYQILADKVHIKALSIAQRIQLLHDGLNDRADVVVKTCSSKLLQAWLRASAGNVLDLLKSLDVESSMETCDLALATMFKASPVGELVANFDLLGDKNLMDEDKLTCESAMYWCRLCKYVHSLGTSQEELLDMVLPSCVDFCQYIKKYVESCKGCDDVYEQLEQEFIIQQLLSMTSYMDLSDQASRKELEKLLDEMLLESSVSHSLVQYIMPRLMDIRPDPEVFVSHLAETISDIREPITVVEMEQGEEERRQADLKLAKIRVDLNQIREEMDECIQQQDFSKAAELKEQVSVLELEKSSLNDASQPQVEEVRTEKTDDLTWLKCLSIVSEMMENLPLKTLPPAVQMIIESLILPGIQNESPDVRNLVVKSLGLCCLLKKETALQHLVLFVQVSQVDTEGVRAMALRVLFDLLHKYGLEVLQVEPQLASAAENTTTSQSMNVTEAETIADTDVSTVTEADETGESYDKTSTASNLMAILSSVLDGESSELRTVAAEGLAKLLLSGRVQSAKLLSHLILLWYNPVTEEDSHLRHCLGAFLPVFAIAGRCNQEVVEEAFMPTLKTLFNAPSSSPLADVDVDNVADLLVQLTSARLLSQNQNITRDQIKDHTIHDNLALKVCNEILSHPDSFSVRVLVKIANSLDISKEDVPLLKDLSALCGQMLEAVKEKQCVKGVQKFQTKVSELLQIHMPKGQSDVAMEITNDNTSEPDQNDTTAATLKPPEEGPVVTGSECDVTNAADQLGTEMVPDISKSAKKSTGGATAKTPTSKPARKGRSRASAKTPSSTALAAPGDLENNVFLSPTPIRKSGQKSKNKVGSSVKPHMNIEQTCSTSKLDVPDESTRKSSSGRRQSNRRVLFDVDNTSLQE